jgi:hypothetical protein
LKPITRFRDSVTERRVGLYFKEKLFDRLAYQ